MTLIHRLALRSTVLLVLGLIISSASGQKVQVLPTSPVKPTTRSQAIPEKLKQLPTVRGQFERQIPPSPYKISDDSPLRAMQILAEYEKTNPDLLVKYSENGTISFLIGSLLKPYGSENAPQQLAEAFLQEISPLLKMQNPSEELKFRTMERDALGNHHLRFDQLWQEMKVYGADLIVHINKDGVYGVNGRYIPSPKHISTITNDLQIVPVQKCVDDLATKVRFQQLSPEVKQLMKYYAPKVESVIWNNARKENEEDYRLVYRISIRPNIVQLFDYFVDARSGEILHAFDQTCQVEGPKTAQATDLMGQKVTVHFYELNGKFYLLDGSRPMFNEMASNLPSEPVGAIATYDAENTEATKLTLITNADTNWTNAKAVSAHNNAALCYEYYYNKHKRNSINGQGGTIISVINVGTNFENAYWNGQFMAYGDGGFCFQPLAKGLDVAGHEMTHGVVGNSAGLIYQFQSGAMNESFADIFGVCIDPDDWKIGEDVSNTTCFPSGALRDLESPNQGMSGPGNRGWQPKKMSEYVDMSIDQDQGGVHMNSGIPNHAFYLFSMAVTRDTAEKIFYHTLTKYLTASSKFIDLRIGVIRSCKELYPKEIKFAEEAAKAFDLVEIFGDSPSTKLPNDLPPVVGEGFILLHALENQNGIFLYNERTRDVKQISNAVAESRASVDDEGAVAFFIKKSDQNMYSLTLDGEFYTEKQWTTDNYWKNVAISRDGKRLACVSQFADSSIYVIDLSQPQITMKRFILYHPTYTPGVNGGNPRFADAIEFDASGEYVIYDAKTETQSGNGQPIEYWDIGLIRVWDKAKNDFAGGTVQKLFTSLPEKVSITNPTFSKNTPYIIAYDYVYSDKGNNSYTVSGYNLERSQSSRISNVRVLGFPTFNTLDNKLAFSQIDNNLEVIQSVNLQTNKISRDGNPKLLLDRTNSPLLKQWPVWFTKGERPIPTNRPKETAISNFSLYPNPNTGSFLIEWQKQELSRVEIMDLTGKVIRQFSLETPQSAVEINTNISNGLYLCKVVSTNGQSLTHKILIQQ
jgi:Zn-dependent metalloprotease